MRVLSSAMAALVVASASAQVLPWVPGVCVDMGTTTSVGLGCGVVGTTLDAYKPINTTQYKIRPVVQVQPCLPQCYTPGHATDPDCQYCTYQNTLYPNMTYAVPQNIFVMQWTGSSSCFEQNTCNDTDDLVEVTGQSHSSGGWFSWSCTVTVQFMQRYYEDDSSLSLFVQRYVYHQMALFPTGQTLDPDFDLSCQLLPEVYNASTKGLYFQFINAYGTHFVDSAYMGGLAMLTAYFHSCFTLMESGSWTYHNSGSSFFGIFNHDSTHAQAFGTVTEDFYQYSNCSVNLYGGFGDRWGNFNWSNPVPPTEGNAWAASIYLDMVPVIYHITPLPYLINSSYPNVALQLNASIQEYFLETAANMSAMANSLAPRQETTPPWCHPGPPSLRGGEAGKPNPFWQSKLQQLGLGDPAPLPSCPDSVSAREGILSHPNFKAAEQHWHVRLARRAAEKEQQLQQQ